MKIGTLKRFLCTLAVGVALLLGMSLQTQAQRRYPSSNGRWRARNYGQQVSARRHERNRLRHVLSRHQRVERRILNTRLRTERATYGNNSDWRTRRREERAALRTHQREERGTFKQRWKNNGKHR
ncbi:MAG: hypothetical protein QOH25_2174 [Acidobacteriota bacterium]|nr:hypothetical protein [Acidobacteriota bacterium]